jgi:hypothetical protein
LATDPQSTWLCPAAILNAHEFKRV